MRLRDRFFGCLTRHLGHEIKSRSVNLTVNFSCYESESEKNKELVDASFAQCDYMETVDHFPFRVVLPCK